MDVSTATPRKPALRAGMLVEVRSADEIQATLDENGELESLPFMPEMLSYCGRRLRVDKVATKLCDTVSRSGMRKMRNAVHLVGVRCDGSAHGGCEAGCLMYWKEAWLRPVEDLQPLDEPPPVEQSRLLPLLMEKAAGQAVDGTTRYRCQATELLRAAPEPLPWRNLNQYAEDVRVGNVGLFFSARAFLVGLFDRVQTVSQRHLPRWLWFRGGLRWGFLKGTQVKTPTGVSGLQPGELVRIKSKDEIMKTLNSDLLNRGMGFDAEMSRFCGRVARVARRVNMIIDEKTGRMIKMKYPCIILEGIICEGAYTASCPRGIPAYWREIWLERVPEPT